MLIYCLLGDFNLFYVDFGVVVVVGFLYLILYGFCIFGVVGCVLLVVLCDNDFVCLR